MGNAFDDLERQLRRAVKATNRGQKVPRRGWKRTAVLALAAALLVSGAALAATRLTTSTDSAEVQGRKIALQAIRDTQGSKSCQRRKATGLVMSDGQVLPEITRALPALAEPVKSTSEPKTHDLLRTLPQADTGMIVIARTLRVVHLQHGLSVIAYVQAGGGSGPVDIADPAGCGKARRDRAASLAKNRSSGVQRWAYWRLAEMRDTAPGLQTLWVFGLMRDRRRTEDRPGVGGAGIPVRPGEKLRHGVLLSSTEGREQGGTYVGIAGPRTTHLIVRPDRPVPGTPQQVPVRHGFFIVQLPQGTGLTHLLEVTANGTVVRKLKVR